MLKVGHRNGRPGKPYKLIDSEVAEAYLKEYYVRKGRHLSDSLLDA